MFLNLGVGAAVARYLGADLFGQFSYATASVGLIAPLAGLGLDSIVMRDLVRKPELKGQLLSSAFALRLLASTIAFAGILVGVDYIGEATAHQTTIRICAIIIVITPFDVWEWWFQANLNAKHIILARNAALVVGSIVKVSLIVLESSLHAFAWAYVLETMVGTIALTMMARRTGGWSGLSWPKVALARRLLGESWPLMLSGMVVMLYMRIDQLMLTKQAGNAETGVYSAAIRISELWYFVPSAVTASVTPSILRAHEIDTALYFRRLTQLFVALVGLAYAVAIPVTLLSPYVISAIFGDGYRGGATVLSLHIWTGVFVALGVARQPWIVAEGLMGFSLASTAAGAFVNVLLNLILIPRYGGRGAAISTLAAQFVAVAGSTLLHSKGRVIFRMQMRALVLNGGRMP